MYGVGSSLLYFPVLAVAPEYFDAHRGSAMGFILSAAGVGGVAYAPTVRLMLARVGVRWTLRTLGLVNFAICLPIAFTTPPSRATTKRPTLVNIQLAKKPAFILQAVAAMAQAAGNFVPITFIPEFSTRLGYTAAFGAALLAINNSVNTLSRIVMGFIADVAGRQNTLVLSVLGSALTVVMFWLTSAMKDDMGLWIAFVVSYGVFAGGEFLLRHLPIPSSTLAAPPLLLFFSLSCCLLGLIHNRPIPQIGAESPIFNHKKPFGTNEIKGTTPSSRRP